MTSSSAPRQDVQALVRQALEAPQAPTRRKALQALQGLVTGSTERRWIRQECVALLECLRDDVLAHLATLLGHLPLAALWRTSMLRGLLHHPFWKVQRNALISLRRLALRGPGWREVLAPFLTSPHWTLRAEALLTLSKLPPDRRLHALWLQGLQDQDEDVQSAALHGLVGYATKDPQFLRTPPLVDALSGFLQAPNPTHRQAVWQLLPHLSSCATPFLPDLIAQLPLEEEPLRCQLLESLRLTAPSSPDVFQALLANTRTQHAPRRQCAVDNLVHMLEGTPSLREYAFAALVDPSALLRSSALYALAQATAASPGQSTQPSGEAGSPTQAQPRRDSTPQREEGARLEDAALRLALHDPSAYVRNIAIASCSRGVSAESIERLVDACGHKYKGTRRRALEVLARCAPQHPESYRQVHKALDDVSQQVRQSALKLLVCFPQKLSQSLPALLKKLHEKEAKSREAASQALALLQEMLPAAQAQQMGILSDLTRDPWQRLLQLLEHPDLSPALLRSFAFACAEHAFWYARNHLVDPPAEAWELLIALQEDGPGAPSLAEASTSLQAQQAALSPSTALAVQTLSHALQSDPKRAARLAAQSMLSTVECTPTQLRKKRPRKHDPEAQRQRGQIWLLVRLCGLLLQMALDPTRS